MTAASTVTVAIPVLDGAPLLAGTLAAVNRQRLDGDLELLVADSGSTDGSRELAVDAGARVIDIPKGEFSHGGTRNLLMREAGGDHVAFVTQDAEPMGDRWLEALLAGFAMADDVALVFGPYRPRPDASPMVRRELTEMFTAFAPDGRPRLDRAGAPAPDRAAADRRVFFSDVNGCVARAAWSDVPFRPVAYAEDQMLARDMLAGGWAKAYQPGAAVLHSHDYTALEQLRRSFDESRALREVHGSRLVGGPVRISAVVQRDVRDDLALLKAERVPLWRRAALAGRSLAHHAARTVGATLGSRADRLSPALRRRLSLEQRDGFDPQC